MKKKFAAFVLCVICLLSVVGCGQTKTDTQTQPAGNQSAAADDYLTTISGTYVELFPELSKPEYRDIWINATTPLVGEEAAEDTVSYLLYMCTGDLYGQEAIDAYEADPDSMRFDCYYLDGVAKMTVEGNTISGVDADGNEIFRHEYTAMDVENENGFLFYQTSDADAGQFTYFAFSPDTMEDTWHLEFRYAEDLNDLQSWFEGNYAYWNVGAIAEDATEEQVLAAINLFVTENLSEEE